MKNALVRLLICFALALLFVRPSVAEEDDLQQLREKLEASAVVEKKLMVLLPGVPVKPGGLDKSS